MTEFSADSYSISEASPTRDNCPADSSYCNTRQQSNNCCYIADSSRTHRNRDVDGWKVATNVQFLVDKSVGASLDLDYRRFDREADSNTTIQCHLVTEKSL